VQTLLLALVTIVISTPAAIALAFASLSRSALVTAPIMSFSWVMRGLPPLIVLFFTFFGLSSAGIDPFPAATIALSASTSAYYLEIFRGGLTGVPRTQNEAAKALGLGSFRTATRILLPQLIEIVRQPYLAQTTTVIKNTSIASVVAVPELLAISNRIVASTNRPFEILLAAAAFYALLNTLILLIGRLHGALTGQWAKARRRTW